MIRVQTQGSVVDIGALHQTPTLLTFAMIYCL